MEIEKPEIKEDQNEIKVDIVPANPENNVDPAQEKIVEE
jgi:hypothetical protein